MRGHIVEFVLFQGAAVLMNCSYAGVEYVHRTPLMLPLELVLLLLLPTTMLMIL
jgi:hypothetical protein